MKRINFKITGLIEDERALKNALLQACYDSKAMIIKLVEHSFYPCGYSAVVLIGESHATVHTFPEKKFAVVDYVSCAKNPRFTKFVKAFEKFNYEIIEGSFNE